MKKPGRPLRPHEKLNRFLTILGLVDGNFWSSLSPRQSSKLCGQIGDELRRREHDVSFYPTGFCIISLEVLALDCHKSYANMVD